MKILFTLGALGHGGGERVVSILANQLANEGHQVEIMLYYDREIWYPLDEKVKVVAEQKEIGNKGILSHLAFKRKYIKANNFDVVISFLAPFNMLNIVCLFGLKTPLIVADRNDPRRIPSNKLVRYARDFLYRFADSVVLQTKANQAYFCKSVQAKSTVIYNPIDLGEDTGIGLTAQKSKRMVSVGRLIRQKNQDMMLEAFCKFQQNHPDYRLTIYGEGDYRPNLEQKIIELGLEESAELPGGIKDVPSHIKDAEFFVLSSDYEGMPNALMEAMCVGLPVISTAVSGATDLIIPEQNGLLVDCDDTEGLAAAMERMASDDELRQTTAQNARKLADELTTNKITAQWIQYIEKIIATKKGES